MAGFLVWLALGYQSSEAQYTANFQTNIISGVSSNWSGAYDVGNMNFADVLLIENGGALSMSNGGMAVGYQLPSSNNTVLITGTGSVWSNGTSFVIGYAGSGNSLVISNGGQVVSAVNDQANTEFGVYSSSSNNSALVTGDGSVWNSYGGFDVGAVGNGNSLVINNGGKVISGFCDLGDSGNNSVLVSDPGSVWSNSGPFTVGRYGVGNSLVITNGGQVVDGAGFVGGENVYGSSSANSVLVVGSGSVWNNSGNLIVGYNGSSNRLTVADDSSVIASGVGLGSSPGSVANQINVTGGSLYVTNASHNAVFNVVCGQVILSAGLLQADTLVMTNSCAQFIHTGGTLIVGNVVLDPNTFRIVSVARQSNDMLVTWMMAPGATNTLQATAGNGSGYTTNGFTDIFVVTNNTSVGTVTNYLDAGAATNSPSRYYRARLLP